MFILFNDVHEHTPKYVNNSTFVTVLYSSDTSIYGTGKITYTRNN